jgi:hypothetical protein
VVMGVKCVRIIYYSLSKCSNLVDKCSLKVSFNRQLLA